MNGSTVYNFRCGLGFNRAQGVGLNGNLCVYTRERGKHTECCANHRRVSRVVCSNRRVEDSCVDVFYNESYATTVTE